MEQRRSSSGSGFEFGLSGSGFSSWHIFPRAQMRDSESFAHLEAVDLDARSVRCGRFVIRTAQTARRHLCPYLLRLDAADVSDLQKNCTRFRYFHEYFLSFMARKGSTQ